MGSTASGSALPQNKITAAPPSRTNTGVPSSVATTNATIAGQTSFSCGSGDQIPTATIAAATANAAARPFQFFAAFQISRTAIAPKPSGITPSTNQRLMP